MFTTKSILLSRLETGSSITNHPTHSGTAGAYPYGLAYIIRGMSSDGENRVT